MLVGIDDTDSLKGMCTTYLAAIISRELDVYGYPRLIRLNPNIPYKTRGNGAVMLNINGNSRTIKSTVLKLVKKLSQLDDKKTNPGVVFLENPEKEKIKILNNFYRRVVSELVTIRDAENVAEKVNADVHKFKNGRGIIGALAAIGAVLDDKTYEMIGYRHPNNYGKARRIDRESVYKMNEKFYPKLFDTIDPETKRILITPRGYDPILFGIRGEDPKELESAFRQLKIYEPLELKLIFETNQATDSHLRKKKITDIKPYDCVIVDGHITQKPKTLEGGHVVFNIQDSSTNMDCAAYEPTGGFRDIVKQLEVGDYVEACGGVGKYKKTINLEKIRILELNKKYENVVPNCCNKKMTSAGKNKGYKCRKCGKRIRSHEIKSREVRRNLELRSYEVPPRARRHLSKPLVRESLQSSNQLLF